MSRIIFLLGCLCLFACSPYKKVVLTMSDQQTAKWKGATEDAVINELGAYRTKTPRESGYILRFDYAYPSVKKLGKEDKTTFSIKAGAPRNQGLVPKDYPAPQYPSDKNYVPGQLARYMDFLFDASHHVNSVYAEGYPDSVYYVKRK